MILYGVTSFLMIFMFEFNAKVKIDVLQDMKDRGHVSGISNDDLLDNVDVGSHVGSHVGGGSGLALGERACGGKSTANRNPLLSEDSTNSSGGGDPRSGAATTATTPDRRTNPLSSSDDEDEDDDVDEGGALAVGTTAASSAAASSAANSRSRGASSDSAEQRDAELGSVGSGSGAVSGPESESSLSKRRRRDAIKRYAQDRWYHLFKHQYLFMILIIA